MAIHCTGADSLKVQGLILQEVVLVKGFRVHLDAEPNASLHFQQGATGTAELACTYGRYRKVVIEKLSSQLP